MILKHVISFRENRDVVIKVVAKGDEGRRELEILQLLNSEPLRSDPANATVRVLEFLEFHDWHFVVMPLCDQCDELPFLNVSEGFDFADQILAVSGSLSGPFMLTNYWLNYSKIGSRISARKSHSTPGKFRHALETAPIISFRLILPRISHATIFSLIITGRCHRLKFGLRRLSRSIKYGLLLSGDQHFLRDTFSSTSDIPSILPKTRVLTNVSQSLFLREGTTGHLR